jgi:hypothetical protein
MGDLVYQTGQVFAGCILAPTGHFQTAANSGRLETTPLMRRRGGECGSIAGRGEDLGAAAARQDVSLKSLKGRDAHIVELLRPSLE